MGEEDRGCYRRRGESDEGGTERTAGGEQKLGSEGLLQAVPSPSCPLAAAALGTSLGWAEDRVSQALPLGMGEAEASQSRICHL